MTPTASPQKDWNLDRETRPTSWRTHPAVGAVTRVLLSLASRRLRTLIYCASTGRSGTASLAQVLETIPESHVEHEGWPRMAGRPMFEFNQGDDRQARRQFMSIKAPRIYKRAWGKRIYGETSHIFLQCYAPFVMQQFGQRVKVIHLVRDPHEVCVSMLGRGDIPRTQRGDYWTLRPEAPRNVLNMTDVLDSQAFADPYFLVRWYNWEMQARFAEFKKNYPDTPTYSIKTESLNDLDEIRKALRALELPEGDRLASVVGTRANVARKGEIARVDVSPSRIREFDSEARNRMNARFGEELTDQVIIW